MKDLHFLFRSRRTQIILMGQLLMLSFFIVLFSEKDNLLQSAYVLIPLLSFFTVIPWEPYFSNFFGMERKAFTLYLYAPVKVLDILLGKNISFFLMLIPSFVISSALFVFVHISSLIPWLFLSQLNVLCIVLMLGNTHSLRFPYPLERNEKLLASSSSGNFSMLGFVGLSISLIIPSLIGLMVWRWGFTIPTYGTTFFVTVLVVILYLNILLSAAGEFWKQSEFIYQSLRKQ